MAAHARLKDEFTEDEKYHNLMRWHIWFLGYLMEQNQNFVLKDKLAIFCQSSECLVSITLKEIL